MTDDTEKLPPTKDAPRRTPARRPRARRRAGMLVLKVVAGVVSATVVAGTGFAWSAATRLDNGFTRSEALGGDAPRSLGGDMNILLIGLDTRKDQNGEDLPKEILSQLHAGDGSEGGYNANSLILVHIPADMHNIVAYSIPRDDYVAVTGIPGYTKAKIKESYGLKKFAVEQKLMNQGVSDRKELERKGREAGRASVVQTVRNLTGVPIDRFAEISLSGFYDLAGALGGVDVCLNHAVNDREYSGANFPAGQQRLNAAQALAFVRQRHGLDNGDLDRTHRQQAFITSVARSLRNSGTLTDFTKLNALADVAHRDVVLSDGWNLIEFARTLGSVTPLSVEFRTLPVESYDMINGQSVNIVDAAAIRKEVRAAFGLDKKSALTTTTAPPPKPTSIVNVVNAGGASGSASVLAEALADVGYPKGKVGNATFADGSTSAVYYGAGAAAEADARRLAETLGGIPATASNRVSAGQLKVVIGSDFTMPDDLINATTTTTPSKKKTAANSYPEPDAGKPVGTAITGDTIPCVN